MQNNVHPCHSHIPTVIAYRNLIPSLPQAVLIVSPALRTATTSPIKLILSNMEALSLDQPRFPTRWQHSQRIKRYGCVKAVLNCTLIQLIIFSGIDHARVVHDT